VTLHLNLRALMTGLWVVWGLYWIISARNAKTTQRRESSASRVFYSVLLLSGGLLMAVPRGRLGWLAVPLLPDAALRFRLALVLLAAGLAFTVWARLHLGRNWSGTVTLKEGHELIRTGPYALVRHPIYAGLLLAFTGTAIACGDAAAVIGLLLVLVSFLYKLRIEEAFMRAQFPAEYASYAAAVPALVPFTGARRSAPR
jgi:protein-S-isoprenylcysteine O-methyltransferase Ste14